MRLLAFTPAAILLAYTLARLHGWDGFGFGVMTPAAAAVFGFNTVLAVGLGFGVLALTDA